MINLPKHKHAEAIVREFELFAHSTLDGLSAHIAILDESGVITATNQTWRDFARANRAGGSVAEGANYLQVCDMATGARSEESAAFAEGIRSVLNGQREEFALEYPCHSPTEQRWFIGRVTHLPIEGPLRVMVTHETTTERKQAEEALRQSEERFLSLVENASGIITILEANGTIRYISPSVKEVLGYEPEEMIGKKAFDLVHPEDAERTVREFEEALSNPETHSGGVENRLRHADGSWRRLYGIANNRLDDPSVRGIIINSRDITEREQAEEALTESEARYARIVANAPGMVYQFVLRPDGSAAFPYVSEGSREMFGLEPWEIQEDVARLVDAIQPEDRPSFDRSVAESAAKLTPWRWEGRFTLRSGEQKWIQGASRPERQANNDILWDGLLMDVTQRKRAEEQITFQAHLLDTVGQAVVAMDMSGRVSYWNYSAEQLYGWSAEEVLGQPAGRLLVPEDQMDMADEITAKLRAGKSWSGEFITRHRDGTTFPVLVTDTPVHDEQGNLVGMIGVSTDITERKKAEEERSRLAAIVECSGDAIIGKTLEGTITSWNRSAQRIYGYSLDEVIGKPISLLIPPDRADELPAILEKVRGGEIMDQYETVRVTKGGERIHVSLTVSPTKGSFGEIVGASTIARDISDRKALEERLEYQALHDPLTELPNRTLLADRLRQALARAARSKERVAVLFLDLDNFKVVNDSLGHEAGDLLLVAVAKRLSTYLRDVDTIARFGGDEFVVVLEGSASTGYATWVAERITEALQAPFALRAQEVSLNTSIGIAFSSASENERPEVLVRNADTAMYAAKRRGKSRHAVFEPSMNRQALERLNLENDLRKALKNGEFVVHYQPKISLETGGIVGFEALVRWEHPERGMVYPAEFIPLAEDIGLIVSIGNWVLAEACRQVCEWQARHPAVPLLMMNVNLSAKQFERPGLVRDVARVLEETGMAACCLNLEITESVVMQDAPLAASIMGALKALGVCLSIDDFGTGYSSLSYLQRFPADYLKIDRSFVSNLDEYRENEKLVSGMISLAHTLGLKVVAEGVETVEQLTKLREASCDVAQGYYFSKSLPSEAAEVLVEKKVLFSISTAR